MALLTPLQRAADDLLLLFDRFETPGIPEPEFTAIGATMSGYIDEVIPKLVRYAGRNSVRQKDVTFGFETAVDALTMAAGAQATLAARLLAWSAKRTGLSHAEVLRGVLDHTDVEEGNS